jgi:hypothetical protein
LSQRNHPFVIVVTDSSVSDNQLANRFGANRAAKGLAVVTTNQVPETIVPSACMAAYFIYYLGRYTLSFLFPDIRNHSEPRSCVFDHKIRKSDMVQSMIAGAICDECRQQLLSSGGLGSATSILALDRLFALSGDILKQPIGAAEIGVKDKQ